MREVKFRVYHKKLKRMFYPGEFRLKFNRDHKWYVLINPLRAPESPRYVDIMEYTGLMDYWEGDILNHKVHGVVVVEHKGAGFCITEHGRYIGWLGQDVATDSIRIGNIWENSELLKGGEKNDNVQTGRPVDSASEPN